MRQDRRGKGRTLQIAALCLAAALTACARSGPPAPAAAVSDTTATATQSTQVAAAGTASDPAATTAVQPVAITIAPVTGVPADVRFGLETLLKSYAKTRKITVVAADDPAALYHLKGRFSAVASSVTSTIVYVWTVTDASGRRVHHMAGSQNAGGTNSDPWTEIKGTQLDAAARETIDAFADWVRKQPPAQPLQ